MLFLHLCLCYFMFKNSWFEGLTRQVVQGLHAAVIDLPNPESLGPWQLQPSLKHTKIGSKRLEPRENPAISHGFPWFFQREKHCFSILIFH